MTSAKRPVGGRRLQVTRQSIAERRAHMRVCIWVAQPLDAVHPAAHRLLAHVCGPLNQCCRSKIYQLLMAPFMSYYGWNCSSRALILLPISRPAVECWLRGITLAAYARRSAASYACLAADRVKSNSLSRRRRQQLFMCMRSFVCL